MIRAANHDIRRQLQLAELRRAQITKSPFACLDRLIAELEGLHLDGLQYLPPSFVSAVSAINRLLPEGTGPIPEEPGLIRDTIDRCFDIQEQLVALPEYRLLGRESDAQEDGGGPP